jgi:hypothetical protein
MICRSSRLWMQDQGLISLSLISSSNNGVDRFPKARSNIKLYPTCTQSSQSSSNSMISLMASLQEVHLPATRSVRVPWLECYSRASRLYRIVRSMIRVRPSRPSSLHKSSRSSCPYSKCKYKLMILSIRKSGSFLIILLILTSLN